MRYLYNHIDEILDRIHQKQKILLLLDYDGTVTPIVKKPELARLNGSTRRLLKSLSKKVILGIISGRSLKDVKAKVGIGGIIYAGNHGLEIEAGGRVYVHPEVRGFSKGLDRIAESLHEKLDHIPGIIVEHKGLTLSLHYRCVNRLHQAKVKHVFYSVVKSRKITNGKKVFEVRPPVEWDKGRAVTKIIRQIKGKVLPLYIGDDVTDENAFKAIKTKVIPPHQNFWCGGITIYVGRPKKSHAEYFVWNVEEVLKFLRKI